MVEASDVGDGGDVANRVAHWFEKQVGRVPDFVGATWSPENERNVLMVRYGEHTITHRVHRIEILDAVSVEALFQSVLEHLKEQLEASGVI